MPSFENNARGEKGTFLFFLVVFFFSLLLLAFGTALSRDGDLWLHLTVGRLCLAFPQSWNDPVFAGGRAELFSWGTGVVYEVIYRLAGYAGLHVLRAASLCLLFGVAWRSLRSRGFDAVTQAICLLVFLFLHLHLDDLRPALFGEIFLVLFASHFLFSTMQFPRFLPFFLCFIVWHNLHASALILIPWSAGYGIFRSLRLRNPSPLALPIQVGMASLIHPHGVQQIPLALSLSKSAKLFGVTEWLPADAWQIAVGLSLFVLVFFTEAPHMDRGDRLFRKLVCLAFCLLSLLNRRGLVFFWVPLLYWLPVWISFLFNRIRLARSHPRTAILLAVTLLIFWAPFRSHYAYRVPEKAVAFLNAIQFQGNIFNYPEWGGYLTYELPQSKVVADSRVWGSHEFLKRLSETKDAKGVVDLPRLLEAYPSVDAIFFPSTVPVQALFPQFKVVYENNVATVALRDGHPALPKVKAYFEIRDIPFDGLYVSGRVARDRKEWFLTQQQSPWLGWFPTDELVRQAALTDLAFFRTRGMLKLSVRSERENP